MNLEQLEWLNKAITAIKEGVTKKCTKDNLTVYLIPKSTPNGRNVIRLDIKEEQTCQDI